MCQGGCNAFQAPSQLQPAVSTSTSIARSTLAPLPLTRHVLLAAAPCRHARPARHRRRRVRHVLVVQHGVPEQRQYDSQPQLRSRAPRCAVGGAQAPVLLRGSMCWRLLRYVLLWHSAGAFDVRTTATGLPIRARDCIHGIHRQRERVQLPRASRHMHTGNGSGLRLVHIQATLEPQP